MRPDGGFRGGGGRPLPRDCWGAPRNAGDRALERCRYLACTTRQCTWQRLASSNVSKSIHTRKVSILGNVIFSFSSENASSYLWYILGTWVHGAQLAVVPSGPPRPPSRPSSAGAARPHRRPRLGRLGQPWFQPLSSTSSTPVLFAQQLFEPIPVSPRSCNLDMPKKIVSASSAGWSVIVDRTYFVDTPMQPTC